MRTIYKNHPGGPAGYIVHNRETIKFDAVERTTHYNVYPNQLNRLKRVENCIPSNHSPCFFKLPKQNGANRLIFLPECPVFPCKFKAVARAEVIHFVNLCAAVISTLFVIIFFFFFFTDISLFFKKICIQLENPNFWDKCEIRAYSLKEAILTVSL